MSDRPASPDLQAEAERKAWDAGFLAGFNASCEGYNGEYPFDDKRRNPAEDAGWL